MGTIIQERYLAKYIKVKNIHTFNFAIPLLDKCPRETVIKVYINLYSEYYYGPNFNEKRKL